MIASIDSSSAVTKLCENRAGSNTERIAGTSRTRCHMSTGPSKIANRQNRPMITNATSLMKDSKLTASISPDWCSVASIWRVPNSSVKIAIRVATTRAMSGDGATWGPTTCSKDRVTALSCKAM